MLPWPIAVIQVRCTPTQRAWPYCTAPHTRTRLLGVVLTLAALRWRCAAEGAADAMLLLAVHVLALLLDFHPSFTVGELRAR
jgi:hypothetical protein